MNKQEIAQGLSPFVMMAFVDAQNLETGFLTRHRINKLTKEQIMGFSMETEKIINQLSHQLEQVADGNCLLNGSSNNCYPICSGNRP